MIHATKRAIDFIAKDWAPGSLSPDLIIACTGDHYEPGWRKIFTSRCALDINAGREPWAEWPTCPACLVLLDAALERRGVA